VYVAPDEFAPGVNETLADVPERLELTPVGICGTEAVTVNVAVV
jgi:hypothetical protein